MDPMPDSAPTILISVATLPEITPLLESCRAQDLRSFGGRKRLGFGLSNCRTEVLVGGPGAVNTAQSLTAYLEHKRADLIVQTGCAGFFPSSDLALGDVAIASECIDIHCGVENPKTPFPLDKLPFSLLSEESDDNTAHFVIAPQLVAAATAALNKMTAAHVFRIASGPILTVATITATNERAADLFAAYAPLMEAMEGAAAAHTARLYDVPFLEIRAASNCVGERDHANWDLSMAFAHTATAVKALIEHLDASACAVLKDI
jgi:futalosine hydrolase